MKHFTHLSATSADEAAAAAKGGDALFIAGGTDLLGTLKDECLADYPAIVIDLKTIPDMGDIEDAGSEIVIGALAKLQAVADSEVVRQGAAALATAAGGAASPTIRHMGTIGGNICQMHRCWYFRVPDDRFHCRRKGGNYCPARIGDNRHHSIFGSQDGCYASSSHDTAPALIALGAAIVTTKREVAAQDFFHANGERSCALDDDEIVTQIRVPKCDHSAFEKFALRKSIDFPIVNCAVAQSDGETRVVLGGVYPAPLRMTAAEAFVAGGITEQSAAQAADAAVGDAVALPRNEYKIEIARTLVRRTLLALG